MADPVSANALRVRFCPSPTGNPHVGLIRTALFNWAFARHHHGTFVFRIEDTDAARDSEESYDALLDALRWLGLDWDEGPEIGGPHAPYRQSERASIYADVAFRLHDAGLAYACYCTTEETAARASAAGRPPGYDNHCRSLTPERDAAYRAEGRTPLLRLRMPARDITFDDLVRGPVTFAAANVPDFVIVRANGQPLYTLVNPVDDALMEITHVLRGEDLLSSTPRQIALYEALAQIGVGTGRTPVFGHLPLVIGEGNKKLSKRDPTSSLDFYRERGFLPEGLVNYLALLGWSFGGDREMFSLTEMAEVFEVGDVNSNPARFDVKKCEAVNADWMRRLDVGDFAGRLLSRLAQDGLLPPDPTDEQRDLVRAAAPLIQERVTLLSEAAEMMAFLLVDELVVDPAAAAKTLVGEALHTLIAAESAIESVEPWSAAAIEEALRVALVEGLQLKPRNAFGPVRVAVTGRTVSPPLFESMELLGRDRSLARLRSAIEDIRGY
ncbi:MAG: glutamate--tRNA ligase [Actinomycetota bacterium]